MRNHRAKVRELISAGESFITTLNESTGHENVALVNKKYHALDAELLACQGQAPGGGKSESQEIYNRLEALRLNIRDVYQKLHANVQNNRGLTPLDVETHLQQNQMLSNTNTNMPNIGPSDSVSNIGCGTSTSCTSLQLARKQISLQLKRQKAKLRRKQQQIEFEREFQQQKQQQIEFEREFQQQKQQQIEIELRQAKLDAEEQMLNLSNPNSVVSALPRNQQQVYQPFSYKQPRERLGDVTPKYIDFASAQPHAQLYRPLVESTANTKFTPL